MQARALPPAHPSICCCCSTFPKQHRMQLSRCSIPTYTSASACRCSSRGVALRVRAVAAPAAAAQQQKMDGKSITFMKYQGLGNDFILVRGHLLSAFCSQHKSWAGSQAVHGRSAQQQPLANPHPPGWLLRNAPCFAAALRDAQHSNLQYGEGSALLSSQCATPVPNCRRLTTARAVSQ